MIYKTIEVSITKTSLKKHNYVGILSNDVPAMIYLLFKIINPEKRISNSNLKY